MRKVIKTSMLLIGGIIGAGFASGQEINIYFNMWSGTSYVGLVISSFILSSMIYIVANYVQKINANNYKEFLLEICNKNSILAKFNNIIITGFLLCSFYIMIIGFITVLYEQYGINNLIGWLVIALVSYMVLQGNMNRIVKVNVAIVPLIIIFIFLIGHMDQNQFNIQDIYTSSYEINAILGGLIYAGYNFAIICPLLVISNKIRLNKKENKMVALIIFLAMLLLGGIILKLVSNYDLTEVEIPLLYITSFIGNKINLISGVLIILAILTSIICAGYSFLNNVAKKRKTYFILSGVICTTSVIFINMDFSSMMSFAYTFFGILGIMQIFLILLAKIQNN